MLLEPARRRGCNRWQALLGWLGFDSQRRCTAYVLLQQGDGEGAGKAQGDELRTAHARRQRRRGVPSAMPAAPAAGGGPAPEVESVAQVPAPVHIKCRRHFNVAAGRGKAWEG